MIISVFFGLGGLAGWELGRGKGDCDLIKVRNQKEANKGERV